MSNCQHCTANTTNGLNLCAKCQKTLSWAIVNTGAYYADLNRIRPGTRIHVRQVPHSQPPTSLTPTTHDRIGDALEQTENLYTTTITQLGITITAPRDNNHPTGFNITANTVALETNTTRLAATETAGTTYTTWRRIEHHLKKLVETTDTGWYAGICSAPVHTTYLDDNGTQISEPTDCPRGLYATIGTNWITCPACGATYDVNDRRETMRREAHNTLAPLSTIAAFVVCLDPNETSVEKMNKRLKRWVERGHLDDYGIRVVEGSKKPARVYRIGDVLGKLEAS